MIKYIGSKRVLVPKILSLVEAVNSAASCRTVADLFSGTARVGHALKSAGYQVTSNDLLTYSYVLSQALVAADERLYPEARVGKLLRHLNGLPPQDGWFSDLYSRQARYFHPKNAARIQAIRVAIDDVSQGDEILRAILLTSLMLAADKVDSTVGLQMAYLKSWAPRAFNEMVLTYPPLLPGIGTAMQGEAIDAARSVHSDLAYLDPPYNQHSYLGNYHVWETLVLWDNPETYGVARKRIDCKSRKSIFNHKRTASIALTALLASIKAPHIILSFSDEGFAVAEDIEAVLASERYVLRLAQDHKRYVGALIGIYNPSGVKVGGVSHTRNSEYLFVATKSRTVAEALRGASTEGHRLAAERLSFS